MPLIWAKAFNDRCRRFPEQTSLSATKSIPMRIICKPINADRKVTKATILAAQGLGRVFLNS